MIGIELGRVVVDEAIIPHGQHARAGSQPTALELGLYGVERLVYLPGLALVAAAFMDGTTAIVPVEHVWTMSPKYGERVLEKLAEVIR